MINIIEKDLTKLAAIHIESKAKYFVQVNSIDEGYRDFIYKSLIPGSLGGFVEATNYFYDKIQK